LKTKLSSNEEYQKLQKRFKDIEAKIKELEKEGKK
jgi:tetrahydromethanopterin S-methyltransferase subunit G